MYLNAQVARLAELPNVVAIKEASGNLAQIGEILLHRPAHFAVLSGDDALTLAVMAAGLTGVTPAVLAHLQLQCMNALVRSTKVSR